MYESAQGVVEVGHMTTASFCGAICGIEPRSDAAGLTITDGAYCFYCRMRLGVTVIDGNCRPIRRFPGSLLAALLHRLSSGDQTVGFEAVFC